MKRILAVILVVLLVSGLMGCSENQDADNPASEFETSHDDATSGVITNGPEEDNEKPEEVLWQYLEDLTNGDLLSAAQYTCYAMEEIYEDLIIKRCRNLGISKQDLYERIQETLDNENVKDYMSFMKAAEDYFKINTPQENFEDADKNLEFYKREYKVVNSSAQDIKDFFNSLGDMGNEFFGELYEPYLTSDFSTQYKKIYVPEENMSEYFEIMGMSQNLPNNKRILNLTQNGGVVAGEPTEFDMEAILYKTTFTRFLKKTEHGWKLIDAGVISVILTII